MILTFKFIDLEWEWIISDVFFELWLTPWFIFASLSFIILAAANAILLLTVNIFPVIFVRIIKPNFELQIPEFCSQSIDIGCHCVVVVDMELMMIGHEENVLAKDAEWRMGLL